jgi:molybdopterin/thiamine biosynthesis adenylyltransferase
MTKDALFARIATLFDVGSLSESNVLIAGCGSGGGQVALQLVMSGVRNFTLFDTQTLGVENLIRHVCGRRYLGWKKTEALADVLKDRNADIQIDLHTVDLMDYEDLDNEVQKASVVVLATDNDSSRYKLNEVCVKNKTPFVVGRVFTRGIGGEVFSYRPSEGGCLACLESFLDRTPYRTGVRELDLLSDEERQKVYGMEVGEIKDSPGLNVDISFITSFHTRYVLDVIMRRLATPPRNFQPIDENYIVWGNRPTPPFTKHFQIQRITIHPQQTCMICQTGNL